MRVLVLGAYGMLGHRLLLELGRGEEAFGTCRSLAQGGTAARLIPADLLVPGVDAARFESVAKAISSTSPDAVVNCIGVVKQLKEAHDPVVSELINSTFPHLLAEECARRGARLVHFSTDCVFSGTKGMYTEEDVPDPIDLYGRTKLAGEVRAEGCVTLRTSLIGRELGSANGLVEWFLRNRGGRVKGYTNAVFSGFTTTEMARVVRKVLTERPRMSGVWHVASKPISKYDLLMLVNERMGLRTEIEEEALPRVDRSLDGRRFGSETGYSPPSWEAMVGEMALESHQYER